MEGQMAAWNWNLEADGFKAEEFQRSSAFDKVMVVLAIGAGMIISGEMAFIGWAIWQSAGLPVWMGVVLGMAAGVTVTWGLRMIAGRHSERICRLFGLFEE